MEKISMEKTIWGHHTPQWNSGMRRPHTQQNYGVCVRSHAIHDQACGSYRISNIKFPDFSLRPVLIDCLFAVTRPTPSKNTPTQIFFAYIIFTDRNFFFGVWLILPTRKMLLPYVVTFFLLVYVLNVERDLKTIESHSIWTRQKGISFVNKMTAQFRKYGVH